jgi:hypothetical protein
MGIDYYSCANCGRNFPDCGNFFGCLCGEYFCSNECGGRQAEDPPDDLDDDDYYEDVTTCILCRKESFTDADMMQFLLIKLNLTYEQAVDMLKRELKDEK